MRNREAGGAAARSERHGSGRGWAHQSRSSVHRFVATSPGAGPAGPHRNRVATSTEPGGSGGSTEWAPPSTDCRAGLIGDLFAQTRDFLPKRPDLSLDRVVAPRE